MNYTIKLNNVKPKDITFSTGTENIIYSKNINEEISGLVTVDINGECIFCEKVTDNHVKAMLSVDGDYFSDVYFKVVKSDRESLLLSKNYTKYKPIGVVREENQLANFVKHNSITKIDQRTEKIIESLKREVQLLKKEIHKNKQLVVEKTEPLIQENNDYKTALLNEHLSFIQKQKNIVKESIKTIYTECVNELTDQLQQQEEVLTENVSKKIKELENNLLQKYEAEKLKQDDVLTEKIDDYSTYLRNFVRENINSAKEKYDAFFNKKFDEQKKLFLENSVTAFSDFKEKLKQEFKEVAVDEISTLFEEKNAKIDNLLTETVDRFTTNLQSKIDQKYSDMNVLFESYVGDITSKINLVEKRIEDIDVKTDSVIRKKEQEIEQHVDSFIKTSQERVNSVNDKFNAAEEVAKNLVESIKKDIQEVKNFTSSDALQRFIVENSTNELLKLKEKLQEEFLKINTENASELIKENNKILENVINNKIKEFSDDLDNSLGDRIKNNVMFLENSLEPVNNKIRIVESKLENLENIANNVISEKNKQLEEQITSYVVLAEEQQNIIKEKLKELDKKSQELVNEKRQAKQTFQQQFDNARMYTDTKVKAAMSEAMQYARKMLDFAGGGGTVAVQFAEGGNVRGPLKIDDLQVDSVDINTTSVSTDVLYASRNIYLSGMPLDDRFINEAGAGGGVIDGGEG